MTLENLLFQGKIKLSNSRPTDEDYDEAVKYLQGITDPIPALEAVYIHVQANPDNRFIVPFILAVLLSDRKIANKFLLADIFIELFPDELFEISGYSKSGLFGSNYPLLRKLIRTTMQHWTKLEMEEYLIMDPKFKKLVKRIKPKYPDERQEIVDEILA